jgi:hypothetical protein
VLGRFKPWAVSSLAFASVGFHLYLIFSGLISNLVSRPLHMMLALPWVFLMTAGDGRVRRWSGYALSVAGVAACLFVVVRRDALDEQYGTLEGPLQFLLAGVLILGFLAIFFIPSP